MYDWNGFLEQEIDEKTIIDYKILEGFPNDLQNKVKKLLIQKWQVYGKMYKMNIQGTDIVVQCMVLYDN